MAQPSDFVFIKSTISFPEYDGTASFGLYLVPFQDDSHPGRSFHGSRLDLDVREWPRDKHSELLAAAKRQAVAVSEKMRDASFDLTDTHMYADSRLLRQKCMLKKLPVTFSLRCRLRTFPSRLKMRHAVV